MASGIDQARRDMASRLKEAREYLGLSQEEVAGVLAVSRPAVSLLESGERRVEALELERLAHLYGRPQEYFTSGRDTLPEDDGQGHLQRALRGLSAKDLSEVARFAQFLKASGPKQGAR